MRKLLALLLAGLAGVCAAQITVTGITQQGITLGPSIPQGGIQFVTTTTISEQRDNNTSACASVNAPSVGPTSCVSIWPGSKQTRFPITSISRSGSTVTVTISNAYNFTTADKVNILGVNDSTNFANGSYQITTVGTNTLKYTQSGSAVTSSGGTATRAANTDFIHQPARNVANFTNDGVSWKDVFYRYTGGTPTTKVIVHFMPWFSCSNTKNGNCLFTPKNGTSPSDLSAGLNTTGGHITVGYTSWDVSNSADTLHKQITAQIKDMKRRGLDGLVVDDNGFPMTTASQRKKDQIAVVRKIADELKNEDPVTGFKFAVQYDQSMWNTGEMKAKCTGSSTGTLTPVCIEKIIICAMDYYNTAKTNNFTCVFDGQVYAGAGFFGHVAYLKDAVNNKPLTGSFLDESGWFNQCTSTNSCAVYNNGAGGSCASRTECWTDVNQGVANHVSSYANIPQFLWRNNFSHSPNSANINAGSYRWHNPTGTQSNWDQAGYDGWLSTAKNSTKNVEAALYRGVDHAQGSFHNDTKIIDQVCGMTALRSASEPNAGNPAYFSASHQLAFTQLITWNDYDEGTAWEPGIDTCYKIATFTIASSTVSYTLGTNNASQAPLSPLNPTLRYADLYATKDGINAARIARIDIASSDSLNLSGLVPAGTYSVYLKIVPHNSMQTLWAGPVTYVQP